ncbi:hypothetical protein FQR65_LT18226 [Abscondita terminalis]|nr:hypothetical protein FQR65_LT18226 [Abscondita terminalis]
MYGKSFACRRTSLDNVVYRAINFRLAFFTGAVIEAGGSLLNISVGDLAVLVDITIRIENTGMELFENDRSTENPPVKMPTTSLSSTLDVKTVAKDTSTLNSCSINVPIVLPHLQNRSKYYTFFTENRFTWLLSNVQMSIQAGMWSGIVDRCLVENAIVVGTNKSRWFKCPKANKLYTSGRQNNKDNVNPSLSKAAQMESFDNSNAGHNEQEVEAAEILIDLLNKQPNYDGPKTYKDFQVQVNTPKRLTVCDLIVTDKTLCSFTGINNFSLLNFIVDTFSKSHKDIRLHKLSIRERIIMTFVKLKCDISLTILSLLFNINNSNCKDYITSTNG